jgi:hypothetical protein
MDLVETRSDHMSFSAGIIAALSQISHNDSTQKVRFDVFSVFGVFGVFGVGNPRRVRDWRSDLSCPPMKLIDMFTRIWSK